MSAHKILKDCIKVHNIISTQIPLVPLFARIFSLGLYFSKFDCNYFENENYNLIFSSNIIGIHSSLVFLCLPSIFSHLSCSQLYVIGSRLYTTKIYRILFILSRQTVALWGNQIIKLTEALFDFVQRMFILYTVHES